MLCWRCHRAYDGHYLHGWPKVDWDAEYREHGATAAGADWDGWKCKYMAMCASFDVKFAKLKAR